MKSFSLIKPFSTVLLLLAAVSTHAQVGVYELDLNDTGTSLNYEFYTGGYFITDLPEGSGTFVFTVERNARRFYADSQGSGQLFIVEDGSSMLSAISGSGDQDEISASLLLTGGKFSVINIGGSISMPVTRNLSGSFQASSSSFVTNEGTFRETIGVAGFSDASMKLDLSLTRHVNNNREDVSTATQTVIDDLERRGFNPEPTPTPTPTPTPEPSPLPGASPEPL